MTTKRIPKDWPQQVLRGATNPVGTHQIVLLEPGHKITTRGTYGTQGAAFGQQTRLLNLNINANVYVASHYPEGRILWTAPHCILAMEEYA
jgi:hypothetical protein